METTTERSPLRALLADRAYWRWSMAVQLLRLAPLMNAFALVLVSIDVTGGPALGGLLVAVSTAARQLAAPFAGRLVDRLGPMKWAPRAMYLSAVGRFAIAAVFLIAPSPPLLVAVAVLASILSAGSGGIARTVLGRIVSDRLLASALALDSTLVEGVLIAAPFVVAGSSVLGSVGPLIAMGVVTVIGAAVLQTLTRRIGDAPAGPEPELAPGSEKQRVVPRTSLWLNRQFLFWVLVAVAFGHLLGTAEIGAFPIADDLGSGPGGAAVLVAVLGVASGVAGVLYAWLAHRIRIGYPVQTAVLLVLMIASTVAIAMTSSWIGLLVAFVALGLCTAPINTVRSHAAGLAVPESRSTEAFSALDAANGLGYALAGLLLAVVPLSAMLALGPVTAVIALVGLPFLLRPDRKAQASPAV